MAVRIEMSKTNTPLVLNWKKVEWRTSQSRESSSLIFILCSLICATRRVPVEWEIINVYDVFEI